MPRLSSLRESIPVVTDNQDGWRTFGSQPPIQDYTVDESQKALKESYFSNPLIHMAVETRVDHTLGDIITCNFTSPGAKAIGGSFWENEVEPILEETLKELYTGGEVIWLIDKSVPGLPTLVSYDSSRITEYQVMSTNKRRVSKMKLTTYEEEQDEVIPLIGFQEVGALKALAWLPINRFGDAIRGVPPLNHIIDTATVFDRANLAMLARLPGLYAIWWDVTLKGYTPARVREWEQENGGMMPEPGSIIAHNDASEWQIKSAAGTARTSSDWNEYYRDFILSSAGISPTAYLGANYRYNEALDPMSRAMKRLRLKFKNFLSQAVAFASGIPKRDVQINIRLPLPTDMLRIATSLERISNALNVAMASGWIEKERASSLFGLALNQLEAVSAGDQSS